MSRDYESNICPDFDKQYELEKAFNILEEHGIFARHNWYCCMGCGCAALPENTDGYVFYHEQDVEHCAYDGELHLRYGWANGSDELAKITADAIIETLNECGIKTTWNGSVGRTIVAHVGKCSIPEDETEYDGDDDEDW